MMRCTPRDSSNVRLLGLAFAGLLVPRSGSAGPPVEVVDVEGPTCPGASLQTRIEQRLASGRAGGSLTGWAVEGVLRQDGRGWALDVAIADPSGEERTRTFESSRCETTLDAAAFAIAVGIDPTVSLPNATSVPDPPPPAEPTPVPDPPPPAEPTPVPDPPPASVSEPSESPPVPPSRRSRLRGALGAGFGLDAGTVAGVAPAIDAHAALVGPSFRVELHGLYRLQSTVRSEVDPDVGARFSAWSLGLRGCGVPRVPQGRLPPPHALEFPVCIGAEGGQVIGRAFGFPDATDDRVPWGAGIGSFGLLYLPRAPLGIGVRGEVVVPFNRAEFVVEGLGVLHRIAAVGGRAFVVLEGRFGGSP